MKYKILSILYDTKKTNNNFINKKQSMLKFLKIQIQEQNYIH